MALINFPKFSVVNGLSLSKLAEELVVFNSSDFPDLKQNDLIKIFQQNDGTLSNSVIFQINVLRDGDLAKDTLSVEKNLANLFSLQQFQDVYVGKVEVQEVAIDLLEVSFKDQYISRSDMWRMKKNLLHSCAYIDQYVQFSDIRAQVSEVWANSEKVKCGYITDNTNFVLRSFTAKVCVFVQMSREMWEYDAYGYLQIERAVNGFLKALLSKWKEKKCCHELTMVLFSRTIFENAQFEDFPAEHREAVRQNYCGKLYIDFYKCVVQNKGLADPSSLLTTLKTLVHKYDKMVTLSGCPRGRNSSASEGNFLEAINFSLNVFERHQTNRNFDRTGQLVVCVTPGVGVFEVDRDLTVLTKERMIDNGIGSDLICLGRQPLHAVPLFTFHNSSSHKRRGSVPHGAGGKNPVFSSMMQGSWSNFPVQDFNIPHWINHSFYTSNPFPDKGTTNINRVPRIKVPQWKNKRSARRQSSALLGSATTDQLVKMDSNTAELPTIQLTNYAEYDKKVFGYQKLCLAWMTTTGPHKIPSNAANMKKKQQKRVEEWRHLATAPGRSPDAEGGAGMMQLHQATSRPVRIPSIAGLQRFITTNHEPLAGSAGSSRPHAKTLQMVAGRGEDGPDTRPVVGSASALASSPAELPSAASQRRALFNPFNPQHMFAPLTANRRRWIHTYPRGPQGEVLVRNQQYQHQQMMARARRSRRGSQQSMSSASRPTSESTDDELGFGAEQGVEGSNPAAAAAISASRAYVSSHQHKSLQASVQIQITPESQGEYLSNSQGSNVSKSTLLSLTDSSMHELNDEPRKSVDDIVPLNRLHWKSLQCPACLPITTDYYPSPAHLQTACSEHSYCLVPDECSYAAPYHRREGKQPHDAAESRSSREIFLELVCQRLVQGFQIIKSPQQQQRSRNNDSSSSTSTLMSPSADGAGYAAPGSYVSPSAVGAANSPFLCSSSHGSVVDDDSSHDQFMLSHGRQYHVVKLSKEEDKIDVKIYKPRHPFKTVDTDYSYMLWPITRGEYQVASCQFRHHKIEDYYWNHHDEYVCDPDENDRIPANLRVWQTKFAVLPNPAKRIRMLRAQQTNNQPFTRFDVFRNCCCESGHDNTMEGGECGAMTEHFVRFLEHLNKIRRPQALATRKSWKSLSALPNTSASATTIKSYTSQSSLAYPSSATPTPPTTRATSSTPSSERNTPVQQVQQGGGRDHATTPTICPPSSFSSRLMQHDVAQPVPLNRAKMEQTSASDSGLADKHSPLSHLDDTSSPRHLLSTSSELADIVTAMRDKRTGLSFLPEDKNFPTNSFVAVEAVHWSLNNVIGLNNLPEACRIFDAMQKCSLIFHHSGDQSRKFVYGYVIYSINNDYGSTEIEDPTSYQYMDGGGGGGSNTRWFEVEIERDSLSDDRRSRSLKRDDDDDDDGTRTTGAFSSLTSRAGAEQRKTPRGAGRGGLRMVNADKVVKIALNNKLRTGRKEWCQVKYQPKVKVGIDAFVFSFELQWMVATATCLFNLLQVWLREASRCELYLVPVPTDPFAFPRARDADPMRSPLFVPLDVATVADHHSALRDKNPSEKELNRIVISVIEKILYRFGFVGSGRSVIAGGVDDARAATFTDATAVDDNDDGAVTRNFVHFTGQMLVQIPLRHSSVHRYSTGTRLRCSAARVLVDAGGSQQQQQQQACGVYWSHNFMQTKRWTTGAAVDDFPAAAVADDFVKFFANDAGRLAEFVACL